MNVSVDLDGVLNFYPANWLDFLNVEQGFLFQNIQEAKKELSYKEYKEFKHLFRDSKYETEAPVRKSMVASLNGLTLLGNTLYVHTSRAIYRTNYYNKTYAWLLSTGLNFSELRFKTDKNFLANRISVHIDDDVEFLKEAMEYPVELKLFLFSSSGNTLFDTVDEASLLEKIVGASK
jgi:hypothetical protein